MKHVRRFVINMLETYATLLGLDDLVERAENRLTKTPK